jgi:2-C-methyl-D-erythritol 4-phosphate cytidylyltransferase
MPEVTPARAACVIVAAGSGSRLGADVPKAFVELAGTSLLRHALDRVLASGVVGHVVAVVPDEWLGRAREIVAGASPRGPESAAAADAPADRTQERGEASSGAATVTVVAGGAERQDSVAAGLAALPDDVDVVLVHDAARCLAPPTLVARVVEAVLAGHGAVVPGLPVTDTIKLVRAVGRTDAAPVRETVDRESLRIAQTPQCFDRGVLDAAHAAARAEAAQVLAPIIERFGAAESATTLAPLYTDDAEMAELVTEVVVVPGDPLAFKITTAQDLAYAEWLLSHSPC